MHMVLSELIIINSTVHVRGSCCVKSNYLALLQMNKNLPYTAIMWASAASPVL